MHKQSLGGNYIPSASLDAYINFAYLLSAQFF